MIGFLGDAGKLLAPNVGALVKGEDTHFGRDVATFAQRNTPFLSSSWYARTAYSRLVMENLSQFLDPEAETLMRRRIKRQEKAFGNSPWWTPGEALPGRLPDLGNAFGNTP